MPSAWFDAHLDLSYLAECGRDVLAPLNIHSSPHPPAAVTIPSLRDGGVRACLGTIFTEAHAPHETPEYAGVAYPIGDAEAAHRAGARQAERYAAWTESGCIGLMSRRRSGSPYGPCPTQLPLTVGILMEGADPIRTPEELPAWVDRGVVAIGLTWARGSRYAAGNHEAAPGGERGLTRLGFAMLGAMDALRIVHDLSHLSWQAMDDLLEATDAGVMATHSNCAAVFQGPARQSQRHLRDEVIREIARRGGVVGINLFSKFLRDPLAAEIASSDTAPWRASLDDVVRHVEHVCEVTGDTRFVGLGSDMDGGFASSWLPAGVDRPDDLRALAVALGARGWKNGDIEAFAWGNWARLWGLGAVT